jgi:hypothetical protein
MPRLLMLFWLISLLPVPGHAAPCTLQWESVADYTDGTVVEGEVLYRVWHQPLGTPPPVLVAVTDTVTIVIPDCEPGEYFVSAHQESRPDVKESERSLPVVIRQRPSANVPTKEHGAATQ